jgi:hypothetical protein
MVGIAWWCRGDEEEIRGPSFWSAKLIRTNAARKSLLDIFERHANELLE